MVHDFFFNISGIPSGGANAMHLPSSDNLPNLDNLSDVMKGFNPDFVDNLNLPSGNSGSQYKQLAQANLIGKSNF